MATRERRNRQGLGPIPWVALTGVGLAAVLAAVAPRPEDTVRHRVATDGGDASVRLGGRERVATGVAPRPSQPANSTVAMDAAAWREAFGRLRASEAEGAVRGEPSGPWLAALEERLAAADRRLAAMEGDGPARARLSLARARAVVAEGRGRREVAP